MKKLFFAALSLVSNFSKYQDESIDDDQYPSIHYTGTEDYFYTFELDDYGKVYKSGTEVSFDQIKEGDKLRVHYDGSVSLVFPPKLNNVTKIEILDEDNKEIEENKEEK